MIKHTRSLAIAVAVIVNSLALATMHLAMGQIAEHERAALSAPERIVVTAIRHENYKLASRLCPAPNLL